MQGGEREERRPPKLGVPRGATGSTDVASGSPEKKEQGPNSVPWEVNNKFTFLVVPLLDLGVVVKEARRGALDRQFIAFCSVVKGVQS